MDSIAGELPRRDFLGVAVAGPVAAGLALCGASRGSEPPHKEVDVAIVGAGLAGLTAARELVKNHPSVCVLEARERVGGRTLDHGIGNGQVVEGGGQWVGRSQTRLLALAKDLGVDTFKSHVQGKMILAVSGLRLTVSPDERESRDLLRVKQRLESLAREVPLEAPWNARNAKELDAITVSEWLRKNAQDPDTRESMRLDIETELGPPERISVLWFLFYVHSAGGLKALNVEGQEMRFEGGPQALSQKMADALGRQLVLDSPVRRVVQSGGNRVEVESHRLRVLAKRVVIAMMPADAQRIEFGPPLPARRVGLAKGWKGEPAIKVNVVYAKPFWREKGLSGLSVSDRGLVGVTFDNSPPDSSRGVILAFLSNRKPPEDKRARRRAILADLVKLFGKPAGDPTEYFETDWSKESWTAGCVSPVPPGVLTEFGAALREPVGRIHWAGTETSDIWCGYMEGAVRSGQRVAAEVLRAL